MANIHIAALHDRIDEEHFEMRLHASAIAALQQRVNLLEAAVRELRIAAFGDRGRELINVGRHQDLARGARARAPRQTPSRDRRA